MREKLTFKKHTTDRIRWRCHEPLRLETFSDAVFAFALTLIVMSIEVPKSFTELTELMKGTLSFGMCFILLFTIWSSQNIFFRRYGLNDRYTTVLNGILLFISLIYIYPLKFLSTLLLQDSYIEHGELIKRMTPAQAPALLIIYGAGYVAIYLLFFLMYKNAERHATELEFTAKELFETQTTTYVNLMSMIIGCISILLAIILPASISGIAGFIYFLIGPTYGFWYAYRGKKSRLLFG
ncbi:MAG: TMEM175 family protein [Mucilaginibacter sp.]|uniref:TMEM175 family protein n=1 Tax=Mucilaginibacter sp. TaxID=1882438 RepID=UPI003263EB9B